MIKLKYLILLFICSTILIEMKISCHRLNEIYGPFSENNYLEMNNTLIEVEKILRIRVNNIHIIIG